MGKPQACSLCLEALVKAAPVAVLDLGAQEVPGAKVSPTHGARRWEGQVASNSALADQEAQEEDSDLAPSHRGT